MRMVRWLLLAACIVVTLATRLVAADWPGWRGDGTGVGHERTLPLYWSTNAGIAWKTDVSGEGNSSPVILGERVFLTASRNAGTNRIVLCLDRGDGRRIWETELPAGRVPATDAKNGYASATPVTDGERVYAFFDSPGLVALDMAGKTLWTRDLGPFKNSYNMASSPVLCGEVVVQCCDQDEGSFMVALDKKTGVERWRTPRAGMSRQFATPLVIAVEGKPQVVVNGERVVAYDPVNGLELWFCRGMRPNVTPSAVAEGGLVYVASGRNGPVMVIDPHGTGDVTETHVRMQVSSGGPYIPSPVVLPAGLLLPGDDGMLRLIGGAGKVMAELRIRGRYTASPVLCDNVLYWPSERGGVAVVRVAGEPQTPRLELVAVNDVGGACLASPAIADGRIFVRTDKALLCISGAEKPAKAEAVELPGTVAELAKLLEEHAAPEGADVLLRIAVVEKLGTLADAEAVPLLRDAALKDRHWDVGEAAAKSLGLLGRPAVPALIALMGAVEWQPYLKTIAADALGQLGVAEAIPALVKGAADRNLLVRLPSLQALGKIAAANPSEAGRIRPMLIAGLDDREGTVRKVAIEGVGRNRESILAGAERDNVIRKLEAAAKDRNPLVAQAAALALKDVGALPKEGMRAESAGAGAGVQAPLAGRWLRAGPVRLKFQDGELRYLSVGEREIVRRVYFAVRDERYDTVMPSFSEIVIDAAADAFSIRLAATCSNDVAGFSWTGRIAGTADGRITFEVSGQADRDFKPPRIGLNVLYGAESLAGCGYELAGDAGVDTPGEFPRLIATKLLSERFRTLRYATADGVKVSVGLVDGKFGMEDQRSFGDSSYKAFSGMPFKYMSVKKGEKGAQTLTIEVKAAKATAAVVPEPVCVTLGAAVPQSKMPAIVAQTGKGADFGGINGEQTKYAGSAELAWGFNVALHLPDDDTFMENVVTIVDQVKSVRAFAPKAKIRVMPVSFKSPYPRPGPDPRCRAPFGAAWVVRVMKCLGYAAVDEAGFDVGAGVAGEMVQELAKFVGRPLVATTFAGGGNPAGCDVLAVEADGRRHVWVVNLTGQALAVRLAGVDGDAEVRGAAMTVTKGAGMLNLAPYEVCRVRCFAAGAIPGSRSKTADRQD